MSLIKFNKRNRLFPWNNTGLKDFLSSDDFFNNDFFEDDSLFPALNVKEHNKDFEIEFVAPGFAKKDIEVAIKDNMLEVSGEKTAETKEENEEYTRKEYSCNSFKRSIRLPETVDVNSKIKASYNNGILKLNLLKTEGLKEGSKKLIEIN